MAGVQFLKYSPKPRTYRLPLVSRSLIKPSLIHSTALSSPVFLSSYISTSLCLHCTWKRKGAALHSWTIQGREIKQPSENRCEWDKNPASGLTFCDPMDYSLPGSSVHGILQAWILQWVVMLSSGESSWPRDQNHVGTLPLVPPEKPWFKPRWAEFQSSKTYSYCKTLTGYIMSTSTARRSGKRSCFYGMKGSPAVGLFRNFVRNTQYAYTSCRADILPASPHCITAELIPGPHCRQWCNDGARR